MKIVCVGGGPAGLYFAALMKKQDPRHEVSVYERNPADSTYGWGVTYWQPLLDSIAAGDPDTAERIRAASYLWSGSVVDFHGVRTTIPGSSGFAVSRHVLIDVLARRAAELGVDVRFECEFDDPATLPDADLVIAADGVHSRLREHRREHFGTQIAVGRNKFVWLGTTKVFSEFTFAFSETPAGWIWLYAYGFDGHTSTVIVECAPDTWSGLGFDRLGMEGCTAALGRIFATQLDGHPLLNRTRGHAGTTWVNFPRVTNTRWYHENLVLMGDSAHTTHYSIGSGTILALGDAISLADQLGAQPHLPAALDAYERDRKAAIVPLQGWARYSEEWYENVTRYVDVDPPEFATLLRERRSPILPHVPPEMYCRMYRIMQGSPGLQRLRERFGPAIVRAAQGEPPALRRQRRAARRELVGAGAGQSPEPGTATDATTAR